MLGGFWVELCTSGIAICGAKTLFPLLNKGGGGVCLSVSVLGACVEGCGKPIEPSGVGLELA